MQRDFGGKGRRFTKEPKINRGETSRSSRQVDTISGDIQDAISGSSKNKNVGTKERRIRVPDKPDYPLSLWSILKNSIGKELTKIPMPVNFSEPLSLLQRLAEDFEYSYILDNVANITDGQEQLAYVAAFTVSSYSTTASRCAKPFNPLLGETFEWDRRDDLGWRLISEQVSHHPPMAAQHCEGKQWTCWQEFAMATKFKGKYLQITPLGIAHLKFHKTGNHYTWRKITTIVHNIVMGKLWVDQDGDMDIINHTDGSKCRLTYLPYSYYNKENQRRVKGYVMDKHDKVSWAVVGNWDMKIEIAPVISVEGKKENPIYKTGPYLLAWEKQLPPPDSDKYYNFTVFAAQLNEPEDGVAPTDSRKRPDQRLMEEGKWDEANIIKKQLEDKQRSVQNHRENDLQLPEYEPLWFKKETDPKTGQLSYTFKGDYWVCKDKADWSRCPDIF